MATDIESLFLRHLEYLRRGIVLLASEGALDDRGIGALIDASLEATSGDPSGRLHLKLLQIETDADEARQRYEASAPSSGSEDSDDG